MAKKRPQILDKDEARMLIKEELIVPAPLFMAKRWRNYADTHKFVYVLDKGALRMYYYIRLYHRDNHDGTIRASKR